MAIEKIKRAEKSAKRKAAEKIEVAPNLEEKRKEFQEAVVSKKAAKKLVAAPKPRSNSRRTLAIVIGSLLTVLLTTGLVYAYSWYQSPEKIVMDAAMNAVSAKSATYEGKAYLFGSKQPQINYGGAFGNGLGKLNVAISMPLGGDLSALDASLVNNKDDIYLKIDKVSQLIEETAPPAFRESFQPYLPLIRDDVDGKWINVNQNDIDLYQPVTHVSRCAADIFQVLTTDQAAARTLGSMYLQYPFFKVDELSQPADATGKYRLTLDTGKYTMFKERLYGSEFYASLASCNRETHDVKGSDIQDLAIDLTINKASRELTEVSLDQSKTFPSRIVLQPKFNVPVAIEVPKDIARMSDIQAKAIQDDVRSTLRRPQ